MDGDGNVGADWTVPLQCFLLWMAEWGEQKGNTLTLDGS